MLIVLTRSPGSTHSNGNEIRRFDNPTEAEIALEDLGLDEPSYVAFGEDGRLYAPQRARGADPMRLGSLRLVPSAIVNPSLPVDAFMRHGGNLELEEAECAGILERCDSLDEAFDELEARARRKYLAGL